VRINIDITAANAAMIVNKVIGTGGGVSATIGERIVVTLANTLQIPNAVAE